MLQAIEAPLLSSLQLRPRQVLLIQAKNLQQLSLRDVHTSELNHPLSIERLLCQVPCSVTFLNLKRHAGSQGIGAVSGQQLGCVRSLGQLKDLALKLCVLTSSLLEDLSSLTRQSLSHSNHRHYNIYKLDSFSIYICELCEHMYVYAELHTFCLRLEVILVHTQVYNNIWHQCHSSQLREHVNFLNTTSLVLCVSFNLHLYQKLPE